MNLVQHFVVHRKCPESHCSLTMEQFIARPEQKLVDSMIVSDLISLAVPGGSVAVVSSDDDLWPGMLVAMDIGAHVIQVCTKYASTHVTYLGALTYSYSHGAF
jgi:hypothetical protein